MTRWQQIALGCFVGLAAGTTGALLYTASTDDGPAEEAVAPTTSPTVSVTPTPSPSPTPAPSVSPTEPVYADPLDSSDQLRLNGLGPLEIGMTVEEMEAATGLEARVGSEFTPECRYAELVGAPDDLFFMLSRRVLVRIDVALESTVGTESGIVIGDSERDVERTYLTGLTREPHPYLGERGSYLIVDEDPADGLLLIFETNRGKVTQFRSGYDQQARYIEGCA